VSCHEGDVNGGLAGDVLAQHVGLAISQRCTV
jgi:hypothetical protein